MQAEPELMLMRGMSGEFETFWAAVLRAPLFALHFAFLSCLSQGAGPEAVDGPSTLRRTGNLAALFISGLLEGRLLLASLGRES